MLKYALFCLSFGARLLAASQSHFQKIELGGNIGVFVYQGDLAPSQAGSYKTSKPSLNFFINKIVSGIFALRTNVAIGGLKGDDGKYLVPEYRQQRNFNFKTSVVEVSELLVAHIFSNNLSGQPAGLSPYLFAGIGFSLLNIKRDWSRFNGEYFSSEESTLTGLKADQQHALPTLIPALPLGVGIRYPISSRIAINAEATCRFTFTDYLDGFSKAANDSRKDSYISHSVGLIYRFKDNSWLKCPTF